MADAVAVFRQQHARTDLETLAGGGESALDPADDLLALGGRRLRFLFWWHRADLQLLEDALPEGKGIAAGEICPDRMQGDLSLLGVLAVAIGAARLKKWGDAAFEKLVVGSDRRACGGQQGGEEELLGVGGQGSDWES